MASKPAKEKPTVNPDLPEMLVQAMEGARKLCVPFPTEEEEAEIPNLFGFLSPAIVSDPRYKGDGKPPRVLREPLMLISWDRRGGCWKVSLSDKVLNLGGSVGSGQLLRCLLVAEADLRSGSFRWSERKVT